MVFLQHLGILGWEEERGIDGFSASSWAWITDGLTYRRH
jgi:hypothetical protein